MKKIYIVQEGLHLESRITGPTVGEPELICDLVLKDVYILGIASSLKVKNKIFTKTNELYNIYKNTEIAILKSNIIKDGNNKLNIQPPNKEKQLYKTTVELFIKKC